MIGSMDLSYIFDVTRTVLQMFTAVIVVMIYFYIKHNKEGRHL
jgi:hypothetical protein